MTPGKRKAPAGARADATTKTNQPPTRIDQNGYWAKAAAGKVRPICRKPEVSWYR